MVYLFINSNQIKLLDLKKSLLGQFETIFFEKTYSTHLLIKGSIPSVDFVASAIKEVLSAGTILDKEIFLILPQEMFSFFRFEVPSDIAPSAIGSFVSDKARTNLKLSLEENAYDYFITEGNNTKRVNFFAIENSLFDQLTEIFNLIDLKITYVLPETLTYFKLFEKTLRKDKKENIFYVSYSKNYLYGYLFDTFGLLSEEKWSYILDNQLSVEQVLKEKVLEYESQGNKLNRLILGGVESEHVRQDTFTKSIGVWTNPLKRIIGTFYQDYIKLLLTGTNKPFPILTYDTCFGAFVFSQENKNFSLVKPKQKRRPQPKFEVSFQFKKEVLIFLISFVVSFLLFIVISKFSTHLPKLPQKQSLIITSPAPTMSPPTPTPSFKREDLKIQVLNGSGSPGKATDVKNILKSKGYLDIVTGNADTFDFIQSVLAVKQLKSQATSFIENDLKDYLISFKEVVLDASNSADVVITVGKDFK